MRTKLLILIEISTFARILYYINISLPSTFRFLNMSYFISKRVVMLCEIE